MADRDAFIIINCPQREVGRIRKFLHDIPSLDAADAVVYRSGPKAQQQAEIARVAGVELTYVDLKYIYNEVKAAFRGLMGPRWRERNPDTDG